MCLFRKLSRPNNQMTMLAYRVKYWPGSELSAAAKGFVTANKLKYIPKIELLLRCNEDKTALYFGDEEFKIAWAWNNIPTEEEWNKKSAAYLIRVELRVSHLIPGSRIALLSFELPSSLELQQLNLARKERQHEHA